ncbi:hypothetical protein LIER_02672 [Lithospermum erythrorhizon]|uniref:Uncharacterized protein n=1 Tax=Lithospermum erythrorhizon TaxID=34254 RepID=A0AAV3NUY6_LITER
MRWRVGDGNNIWKNRWVPRVTDFYCRGRNDTGPNWVSQLIWGGQWDLEEVSRVLGEEDAKLILAIPLSRHGIMDRLVWNHTKSGCYLTCSGYKLACTMKNNGDLEGRSVGDGSTVRPSDGLWSQLWRLKIPPRVRNFLWKCLHNILPTKDKLLRRRVAVDGTCALCGEAPETLSHLFLSLISCRFWYSTPWQLVTTGGPWTTFIEWWSFITSQLWKQECEFIIEQLVKPSRGAIKINVDAGWKDTTKQGSVGVVARGDGGQFLAARFKHLPFLDSALVAEAIALREGMEMALRYNWHRVEVESDCRSLLMAINGKMTVPLKIDVLVADIHQF